MEKRLNKLKKNKHLLQKRPVTQYDRPFFILNLNLKRALLYFKSLTKFSFYDFFFGF